MNQKNSTVRISEAPTGLALKLYNWKKKPKNIDAIFDVFWRFSMDSDLLFIR